MGGGDLTYHFRPSTRNLPTDIQRMPLNITIEEEDMEPK